MGRFSDAYEQCYLGYYVGLIKALKSISTGSEATGME